MQKSLFDHIGILVFALALIIVLPACESSSAPAPTDGDIISDGDIDNVLDGDDDTPDGDTEETLPPQAEGSIEVGIGIHLEQDTITFGTTLSQLTTLLGDAIEVRNIDNTTSRFRILNTPVSGLLHGTGVDATLVALTLVTGFNGKTADGIGIGSSRTDVDSLYGVGVLDPFLSATWHDNSGVVFEMENDKVVRIHLKAPAEK